MLRIPFAGSAIGSCRLTRAGEEALSAAENWDVLVNNAGVVHAAPLADVTIEQWESTFAVDLRAVLVLTQMVVPSMLARRHGKIINISSIGTYFGTPSLGAYAAAKAGLNQLTRTMAVEWGPHNIQANAICPTVIMTEMGRAFWDNPAHLAEKNAKLQRIPLHRFVETQDVADLVLFLASPSADFINGACIALDGGMSITPSSASADLAMAPISDSAELTDDGALSAKRRSS